VLGKRIFPEEELTEEEDLGKAGELRVRSKRAQQQNGMTGGRTPPQGEDENDNMKVIKREIIQQRGNKRRVTSKGPKRPFLLRGVWGLTWELRNAQVGDREGNVRG